MQLLKEVAGTRVYEQRRQESLKIMDETELKKQKIDELLTYIEERLAELEEEKEELRQYQELDKDRRCLEYTIYNREQNQLNDQLEQLEEHRMTESESTTARQAEYDKREAKLNDIQKELRELKQSLDMLVVEQKSIEDERNEQLQAKARLELQLQDLEENFETSEASRVTLHCFILEYLFF